MLRPEAIPCHDAFKRFHDDRPRCEGIGYLVRVRSGGRPNLEAFTTPPVVPRERPPGSWIGFVRRRGLPQARKLREVSGRVGEETETPRPYPIWPGKPLVVGPEPPLDRGSRDGEARQREGSGPRWKRRSVSTQDPLPGLSDPDPTPLVVPAGSFGVDRIQVQAEPVLLPVDKLVLVGAAEFLRLLGLFD